VKRGRAQSGLTLVEMMVVVSIIALVAAISFPSIASGLDGLRLRGATDSIVSFLNAGMNRAERRQQIVEVIISKAENAIEGDGRSRWKVPVRVQHHPPAIRGAHERLENLASSRNAATG